MFNLLVEFYSSRISADFQKIAEQKFKDLFCKYIMEEKLNISCNSDSSLHRLVLYINDIFPEESDLVKKGPSIDSDVKYIENFAIDNQVEIENLVIKKLEDGEFYFLIEEESFEKIGESLINAFSAVTDNIYNIMRSSEAISPENYENNIEICQLTLTELINISELADNEDSIDDEDSIECTELVKIFSEIRYGSEIIATSLHETIASICNLDFNPDYGYYISPYLELSKSFDEYCLEELETEKLFDYFAEFEELYNESISESSHFFAYEEALRAAHIFNLLDSRGAIAPHERKSYIDKVINMTKNSCEWIAKTK